MKYENALQLLSRFHTTRVLVVGDVILDRFIYGTAERISPEAPIPVFNVDRQTDMPGGAANVARNIAALGGRCTLIGVVGRDVSADLLRQQLFEHHIYPVLVPDSSRPTSVKARYVAESQQMLRVDMESRQDLCDGTQQALLRQFEVHVAETDAIVLSDYAKGVLTAEVIRSILQQAQRLGKPVVVDPKSKDFARYRGATLLTPNRAELRAASGCASGTDEEVEQAARLFVGAVCEAMVVTRGSEGMSVIRPGAEVVHLPTQAREVFDVSGAGDTVVATLALAIKEASSLESAAVLANLAAGIVVGKSGTAVVAPSELWAAAPASVHHSGASKVYSLERVGAMVDEWRGRGLKVAFTNGCFDLLHPGHISLLEQARSGVDRLVVGLNSDTSVRRLKGSSRPVQGELARAVVLSAIKAVDAVVVFAEDTPLELIRRLRPHVLVKGADYRLDEVVGATDVESWGGRVRLADVFPGHSTTETVRRVVGA